MRVAKAYKHAAAMPSVKQNTVALNESRDPAHPQPECTTIPLILSLCCRPLPPPVHQSESHSRRTTDRPDLAGCFHARGKTTLSSTFPVRKCYTQVFCWWRTSREARFEKIVARHMNALQCWSRSKHDEALLS